MGRKRTKSSGTKACTCDRCGMRDQSTVAGTKHRRCGGAEDAQRRPKHSRGGVKGYWR